MADGQLNQMDRWLAPLQDTGPEPETDAWTKAWDSMGEKQSRHAAAERAEGYLQAASALLPCGHLPPDLGAADPARPGQDAQLHRGADALA
jgi:hypothetical protein